MKRLLLGLCSLPALALLASVAHGEKKADPVDFAKQVWPILEKRCIECHGQVTGTDGKVRGGKGGVTLDSKAAIAASKKGRLVVAKKPDESLLVRVISLPAEDGDLMPPGKKGGPLPKEQQELVRRWVAEGASFGTWKARVKEAAKAAEAKGGSSASGSGDDDGDDDGEEEHEHEHEHEHEGPERHGK
ncbi:MAG: c-type cytochrome domain-containing protein [Planctomycetia bacterium]